MENKIFVDLVGTPLSVESKVIYAAPGRKISIGEISKLFPTTGSRNIPSLSVKPYDGSRAYNILGNRYIKNNTLTFRVLAIHEDLYKEIHLTFIQNQLI